MNEERAIADRLAGYADAIAAFSLVNALGFLVAVAELDTRCSLAESRGFVLALIIVSQTIYAGAVVGLQRVEESMREGQESSDKVNRFRRNFYRGRLVFVAGVTVAMTTLSWVALDSSSCITN